jgi:hypothetical protein
LRHFLRANGVVGDTTLNLEHIRSQGVRRRCICLAARTNGDVEPGARPECREQVQTHELAQPPLECVAIDRRMLVSRHDNPYAWKSERGSEDSRIEVHGPNSLPLSNHGL